MSLSCSRSATPLLPCSDSTTVWSGAADLTLVLVLVLLVLVLLALLALVLVVLVLLLVLVLVPLLVVLLLLLLLHTVVEGPPVLPPVPGTSRSSLKR